VTDDALPMTAPVPFSDPALLAELLAQEERLALPRLDYADAARLGALVADLAEERGLPVVVRVEVDTPTGVHTVFQRALPGSSPTNDWWLGRKAATVRRFGHASFTVGTQFRVDGSTFEASSGLDSETYAAHGGGFPLRVDGKVAGVIGVSGLPQQEDHALVVEGLTAYLAATQVVRSPRSSAPTGMSASTDSAEPPREQGRR
jgi:uncharacterized protein (UPF0303 family)